LKVFFDKQKSAPIYVNNFVDEKNNFFCAKNRSVGKYGATALQQQQIKAILFTLFSFFAVFSA